MKKIIKLFPILAIIACIAYFESSEQEQLMSIPALSNEDESVATSKEEKLNLPILEKKLVDVTYMDGDRVEVYREYEVYKDENGKIIKSIPTSEYNYLRYKQ